MSRKIITFKDLFEGYKKLDKNEKEKIDILIDDILEDSDFKNIKIFYSNGEEIELFLNSFFGELDNEEFFEKESQETAFKGYKKLRPKTHGLAHVVRSS